METERLFLNITWLFATVETEPPVLCSVVMVTMDAIHNTAIGTLEHDWFVKIIHVIYTKKFIHVIYTKIQKKTETLNINLADYIFIKLSLLAPRYDMKIKSSCAFLRSYRVNRFVYATHICSSRVCG